MAGSKVLLCLFINNKFCYTDSVDDEDLCEVPEQLRTLEDMLDLAPEPEDSDIIGPLTSEPEPGCSQGWPSTRSRAMRSWGRIRRHERIRS